MERVVLQVIIIGFLILLNGLLAYAEIALVSSRRWRLRGLAQQGDPRALVAVNLVQQQSAFLSAIQVGITLVGVGAGALGGATLTKEIAGTLRWLPLLGNVAGILAFAIVVVGITTGSIVLGELVPKRLALANPERGALLTARFVAALQQLARPAVNFLSWCTEIILRLVGVPPPQQSIGIEEVRLLLAEAVEAGALPKKEFEMAQRVLALHRVRVGEIMTPKPKIVWLNADDPDDQIWHKIVVSRYTYFPVYRGSRDNLLGVVSVKAIYANLAQDLPTKLDDLAESPLVVSETMSVLTLIETFQRHGKHMAMVADEMGNIVGMVTLTDVIEAIAGDFSGYQSRSEPQIISRGADNWLADGLVQLKRLKTELPDFPLPVSDGIADTQTLAGFLLERFGRVPKEGETWREGSYVFEVLDMDGYRIDKVLIVRTDDTRSSASTGKSR